jgi:hypothetical protein
MYQVSEKGDVLTSFSEIERIKAEEREAGRAAYAAELREQGKVIVDKADLESIRATTNDHHIDVLVAGMLGGGNG